jgi:hypothetical protein
LLSVTGSGVFPDGYAVPDGDLLGADEYILNEKAQDALAVGYVGDGRAGAELDEEDFQVVSEFEVGVQDQVFDKERQRNVGGLLPFTAAAQGRTGIQAV